MWIRIVFVIMASLATLFLMFWGMSLAVMPFMPRDPAEESEEVLDYELAEMPEVALPSASAPAISLDTTGSRLGEGDSNPAPSLMRGRWLAGPNANHFQLAGGEEGGEAETGQARRPWLRLTGHTDALWAGYRRHAAAPEGELPDPAGGSATGAQAASSPPLCFEVELLGHRGAQATDEAIASITVEQVESIAALDVAEAECLIP
jgi:hypothetical protein